MSGVRALALLLVTAPACGCYEWHSKPIGDVRPTETIHVELTPAGSTSLASTIGPDAATLDGEVLSIDATRLRIALTQIARSAGSEEFLKNEPVDVPRTSFMTVTVRSIDRPRTLLALGGLAAGILVARIFTNDQGITTTRTGPASGTK